MLQEGCGMSSEQKRSELICVAVTVLSSGITSAMQDFALDENPAPQLGHRRRVLIPKSRHGMQDHPEPQCIPNRVRL